MLFDTQLFIPVTPALLAEIRRGRNLDAVMEAGHKLVGTPGREFGYEVYPEPASAESFGIVFWPFVNSLQDPTEAVIEIHDADGKTVGWQVNIWYNEDDLDDDYDEDDEF
jgi:hypothetical protein